MSDIPYIRLWGIVRGWKFLFAEVQTLDAASDLLVVGFGFRDQGERNFQLKAIQSHFLFVQLFNQKEQEEELETLIRETQPEEIFQAWGPEILRSADIFQHYKGRLGPWEYRSSRHARYNRNIRPAYQDYQDFLQF